MSARIFLCAAVVWVASSNASLAAPLPVTTVKLSETKARYEASYSYPRTGKAAIDRVLEAWVKSNAREFAGFASEEASDAPVDAPKWGDEITYEVVRNDASIFAVVFQHYSFTGGAHPNTVMESFNFLLPDYHRADISELFTPRGIQRISTISIDRLKRKFGKDSGGGIDVDWLKRGAGPNARNFGVFVLQPKELVVRFNPYEVAAYVFGPQEVRIPLSVLKDTMRPDPRAPVASFECAAARSDIEHAICSSRDLAREDRLLGEAYQAKLTYALDDKERRGLRQAQRDWLKIRDTSCRAVAMALVSCLTPVYQKRRAEIEAQN